MTAEAVAPCRARVVLLGASNVTLGLPWVLGTVPALLGPGPLEIFVAAGHGRSYGTWSRVLLRGLPGILDCGLWRAALRPPGAPTYALLTDIGNDVMYGASPAELAGWVSACVDRLRAVSADVVLTRLPRQSLARLRPWQYHLFKAVLYPGRRLPFHTLRDRVAEVDERLAALASRLGLQLVEPEAHWYGGDAIHLRPSQRAQAWRAILSRWDTPVAGQARHRQAPGRVSCRGLAPERRTLCGLPLRRPQPSGLLPDGTRVSLF